MKTLVTYKVARTFKLTRAEKAIHLTKSGLAKVKPNIVRRGLVLTSDDIEKVSAILWLNNGSLIEVEREVVVMPIEDLPVIIDPEIADQLEEEKAEETTSEDLED